MLIFLAGILCAFLLFGIVIKAAVYHAEHNNTHPLELKAMSLEEITDEAVLIVEAKCTGTSEAYRTSYDHEGRKAGSCAITDYYFDIDEVYKGSAEPEELTVAINGGKLDKYTDIFPDEAKIREGQSYVLCLCRSRDELPWEQNEGDKYYIVGFNQGVFAKDKNDKLVPQNGTSTTLSELETLL